VPSFTRTVKILISLEKESAMQESEQFFAVAWIVSLAVLRILFLSNLHLYFRSLFSKYHPVGFSPFRVLLFKIALSSNRLPGTLY
jgi:hypothetical protein